MCLASRGTLNKVLDYVASKEMKALDRKNLAIPMDDLLSYYGAELSTTALSIRVGILLTLAFPLASRQNVVIVFTEELYRKQVLEVQLHLKKSSWFSRIRGFFRSSSAKQKSTSECLRSLNCRLCDETILTDLGHSSCLANLFFGRTWML